MKRKRKTQRAGRADKRPKTDPQIPGGPTSLLLRFYYPNVLTLRQYLVSTLSKSKKRRKKLFRYGLDDGDGTAAGFDANVVKLLDSIVIGTSNPAELDDWKSIEQDITVFTQQRSEATATISPTQGALKQSEVRFPYEAVTSSAFSTVLPMLYMAN